MEYAQSSVDSYISQHSHDKLTDFFDAAELDGDERNEGLNERAFLKHYGQTDDQRLTSRWQ